MGLCKGNLGNLMQHWVLCETLGRLGEQEFESLHMICTHSMAPWSLPTKANSTFEGEGVCPIRDFGSETRI